MHLVKILTIILFFPTLAFGNQKSDLNKSEIFNLNTKNDYHNEENKFHKLKQQGKPVIANKWMVVTANSQASIAAGKILEQGGTAVDAMVTAQLVLGLVEPESSGLGGGAFLVYYDKNKNKITTLDGRETAPFGINKKMFQDKDGNPIIFFDAVVGGKSVGTPGTPALLEKSYEKWGKLSWSLLFKDAINLSENGFKVSKKLSSSIKKSRKSLMLFSNTREYFFPKNVALKYGDILINKNYAKTLRSFSRDGSKIFYKGYIAEDIISTVKNAKKNPGTLSYLDLLNYKIIEREPVCTSYRNHKVCGMGPPSSGALTVSQILGIIENFNISKLGPHNSETWRIIGDASRLAFADRSVYMADSDFIKVPIKELIDKKYLSDRAKLLTSFKKLQLVKPGELPKNLSKLGEDISIELPSTSHISIIDQYGNALSMTTTIENGFGSRLMTNAGFLLNNELTDFSFKAYNKGKKIANSLEPGKRPRSSMSPTIIFKNNTPAYILGSPGGSNIIGYTINSIVSLIDWKMNAQEAASAPHAINKFGTFSLELNTPLSKLAPLLKKMDYQVKLKNFSSGMNIIAVDNKLYGGSDHRREGIAVGE